jgi:hypothetical protein
MDRKVAAMLHAAAAISGVVAALSWVVAASIDLPDMKGYWDQVPRSDPFFHALVIQAQWNQWAAWASVITALLIAAAQAVSVCSTLRAAR